MKRCPAALTAVFADIPTALGRSAVLRRELTPSHALLNVGLGGSDGKGEGGDDDGY